MTPFYPKLIRPVSISKRSILFRLFFCWFILVAGANESKAQWTTAFHGTDQDDAITGMSFFTPTNGYVAFQKFVGYTQDGGKTLLRYYISPSNVNFNGYSVNLTFGFLMQGVKAFSQDSLYVYGHYGTEPSILFSADGAQTWKLVYHKPIRISASTTNMGVTDIQFPGNGNIGFAVHHDEVLQTTNRGQSWYTVLSAPESQMQKLCFIDGSHGYVSGGTAAYKTTDGGVNWQAVNSPGGHTWNYLQSVAGPSGIFSFVNALVGYVNTPVDGSLYRTEDGATTWTLMNDPSMIFIGGESMNFINDSTGYVSAHPYAVWLTKDKGKTWEPTKGSNEYTYLGWGLGSLFFYDALHIWAGGHDEYLLSTDNGAMVTYPQAYFKADTTGVAATGHVTLTNYSRPNYSYKWLVNGTVVATTYNAVYTHNNSILNDTISLVVSNGTDKDTTTQVYYIPAPVVTPPVVHTGWTPIVTGLTDNLRDVRFWGLNGVVLGDKGIYYTTTGGAGAASWTKFAITGNAGDALLLQHTRFVQMTSAAAGKVFICGTDTVLHHAILFYFDMNALTYTFRYIGANNTSFNSLCVIPYIDLVTVVGDNGLIIVNYISTGASVQEPMSSSQNLHMVEAVTYLTQVSILGDSTIFMGDPRPDYGVFNQKSAGNFPSSWHMKSMAYFSLMGDVGVSDTKCYEGLFQGSIDNVKSQGLVFNWISSGYSNGAALIATNHGIYRPFPSNGGLAAADVEYQLTSGTDPVNRVWMSEDYQSTVGYAVGPNGLLLATTNFGGETVPYVSTNIIGACVGQSFALTGFHGTGTVCNWYLDNKPVSSNCASSLVINQAGQHTIKYVTSTASGIADSAIQTININPPPAINLPVRVSDSVLCQPGNITLQISNTENGAIYTLKRKGDAATYGTVTGNGSQVFMTSQLLPVGGAYYLGVSGKGGACSSDFTDSFRVVIAKNSSGFRVGMANVATGEAVGYYETATSADHFLWQFGADASPSQSSDANPSQITYSSAGQKSVTLISWNDQGCYDTLTAAGAFVYQSPATSDSCYIVDVSGASYYDQYYQQPGFSQVAYTKGGYLTCGMGLTPLFQARQGSSYGRTPYGGALLAKYATDGSVRWVVYSRQPDFGSQTNFKDVVNSATSDKDGNIYITGECTNNSLFYFPNGDSVLFTRTTHTEYRNNGFIAKLDPNGVLLWKAILEDNVADWSGVNPAMVYGQRIVLRPSGDLVLTGGFGGNLSYTIGASSMALWNMNQSIVAPSLNFVMDVSAATGQLNWNKYFDKTFYNDLTIDNSGNILLATTTGVLALDGSGAIRWKTGIANASVKAITTDPAGSIYITGGASNCGTPACAVTVANPSSDTSRGNYGGFYLMKLGADGHYNWIAGSRYATGGSGMALVFRNNRIHVLGNAFGTIYGQTSDSLVARNGNIVYNTQPSDFFEGQYDVNGNMKQIARGGQTSPMNGGIVPISMFYDDDNHRIIGGYANNYSGGGAAFPVFGQMLTITGIDGFLLKTNEDLCGTPITYGPDVTDTTGPVIQPEKTQVDSSDNLNVTAMITDDTGVDTTGGKGPQIYYKKNAGGGWIQQPGIYQRDSAGNDTWKFHVDLSKVSPVGQSDTIYYFITAEDSASPVHVSSYPAGDSLTDVNTVVTDTATLSYVVKDTKPPVISSAPITNPQIHAPVVIKATVQDDHGVVTGGSRQPKVVIIADSLTPPVVVDTVFGQLKSGDGLNGSWEFAVPSSFLANLKVGQPFNYYITASDSAGNVGRYPDTGLIRRHIVDTTTLPSDTTVVPIDTVRTPGDSTALPVDTTRSHVDTSGPVITYQGLRAGAAAGVYRLDSVLVTGTSGVDVAADRPQVYFRVGSRGVLYRQPGTFTWDGWSFAITPANQGIVLNPGDTLYYFVVAQDVDTPANVRSNPAGARGSSVLSITALPPVMNYLVLSIPATTPDESTLLNVDLTILPNPNNGIFSYRINGPVEAETRIEVRGFDGRVMYGQNIGMVQDSYTGHVTANLPRGVYFLQVLTERGRVVRLFLVP